MIVYVYPADTFGCGSYRMIWPAEALRAQGHDVRVILPSARTGIGGDIDSRTGQLVDARVPPDADVVVMQRVSLAHLASAVPMMRAKGVAVVIDMDDDLTKIDPHNPAFWAMRAGEGDKRHNWRNAHRACLDATLVTVSTPALLRVYAPHGRGVVLENRVPTRYLHERHIDSTTISWAGSVHSHPQDLQQVGPAIARLAREGVDYLAIGPSDGLQFALGLDEEPPATGTVKMDQWATAVSRIGIGIAPLADTEFNRAKSWLKPLEMMACGVPWVASPRDEYVRLQRLAGVGLMANKPQDWYRQLKRYVRDAGLRAEHSEQGRAAAAGMTIEEHAWRWAEAWAMAMDMQRHEVPTTV